MREQLYRMKKQVSILHYLILAPILGSGVVLLMLYQGRPQLQYYLGVGMAISYFLWGMVHHYMLNDLHRKHMVEYGLIALFCIILLNRVLL